MRLIVVMISFLPILAIGQGGVGFSSPGQKTEFYLTAFSTAEKGNHVITDNVKSLINKISSKKAGFKSEREFLNYVFIKTHQKVLKHYQEYATFGETISNGTYNCLTGTALYALILDHFGFSYKIIETNYHIFLLAETDEGQMLFEATDPLEGFVSNAAKIEKRIEGYKHNTIVEASLNKTYYRFSFELYNTIDLNEVLGLMHYNLAVTAYNNNDLETSVIHLDNAIRLYQSPRIKEFSKIILISVKESKLDKTAKEIFIQKLQFAQNNRFIVTSSVPAKEMQADTKF
jgi:hypothetical protein